MAKVTPEQDLLLSLLKGEEASIHDEVDLSRFFRLLQRHKLLPIAELLLSDINHDTAGEWKMHLRQWAARSMFMLNELKHIYGEMSENGIKAIVLKGPVLSLQLYGNTHQRFFGDLDILIHGSQLVKALSVLQTAGYHMEQMDPERIVSDEDVHFSFNNDLVLYNAEKKIRVELHIGLLVEQLMTEEVQDDFFNNIREERVGQESLLSLNNEYNFLYLCFHGAKHMFFRLSWVKDIARALTVFNLDHNKVLQLSYKYGMEKMLFLSLKLAEEYCNAQIPDIYSERLRNYKQLLRWNREIILGPGELVYEDYSKLKRKQNQLTGVDKVSLRIFFVQVIYLVFLRKGLQKKVRFLLYQVRKRI